MFLLFPLVKLQKAFLLLPAIHDALHPPQSCDEHRTRLFERHVAAPVSRSGEGVAGEERAGMRAREVLATMPSWTRSRRLLSAAKALLIARLGWQWANSCQNMCRRREDKDKDVRALPRHTLHVNPPESHRCEGHSCKNGGEQPANGGVKGRYRALRAIVDTRMRYRYRIERRTNSSKRPSTSTT